MRHLGHLGSKLRISLPTDESGYLGRECPSANCKGYFKITPGTGLSGVSDCHCPYCGHTAEHSEFHTADQVEYAKSVAIRQITDAVVKDLKSLEFDIKPSGPFGIGVSMKVKPGPLHPVHWYREKSLETHVECFNCALKYAVYGVFAFCPDCGQHNSLQILEKSLEVIGKMLDMAHVAETELAGKVIDNSLEDSVSAFDGFGRELCHIRAKSSSDPVRAEKISFQNLEGVRKKLQTLFKLDLATGLTAVEWQRAVQGFQKRHLLAHKMGIVDSEYIRKSGDAQAAVGRKVSITPDEIRELATIIGKLARYLFTELSKTRQQIECEKTAPGEI